MSIDSAVSSLARKVAAAALQQIRTPDYGKTLGEVVSEAGIKQLERQIGILVSMDLQNRQDKERLDWLDANGGQCKHFSGTWSFEREPDEHAYSTGLSLRQAIDRAMDFESEARANEG